MKKIVSLSLAIVLAVGSTLMLSGCSSSDASGVKVVNGEEISTITYTAWVSSSEEKIAKEKMIENFMIENPNIKVNPVLIPYADYDTKLTAMFAAGQDLDVVELESSTIGYSLYDEGKLKPLNSFFENDPTTNIEDYIDAAFYKDGDNIVGMYVGAQVFTMYYNVDLFEKAGLEMPPTDPKDAWSWDEFLNIAQQLTIDKNGNNALSPDFDETQIVQYGVSAPKWWGAWGNFVYSNGGDYVTDDNKFGLAQVEGYEAIQKIADLANVYHVAPIPTAEIGLPGLDVLLSSGQVAMGWDGSWAALALGESGANFGVAPLPVLKTPLVQSMSSQGSITANSKAPDAAWELLKYLNDPSKNVISFKQGHFMPVRTDWLTKPELVSQWTNNEAHPEMYEDVVINTLLNYSVTSPTGVIKNFSKMLDVINPALDNVWSGKTTAEDAMKGIEESIQPLIEGKRQ